MAIDTGELRIRGVNVDEIVAFGVDLLKCFTAVLCQNQMTRPAIAGFDRRGDERRAQLHSEICGSEIYNTRLGTHRCDYIAAIGPLRSSSI